MGEEKKVRSSLPSLEIYLNAHTQAPSTRTIGRNLLSYLQSLTTLRLIIFVLRCCSNG